MTVAVALLLLAAVAVGALSNSSSDRNRSASTPARGGPSAGRRAGAPGRSAPVRHAQRVTALQRREDRAIDATLRYTPVITAGSSKRREIALTFDDGPSPYTGAILRILRRKHAAGTFFVVGTQLNRFTPQLRDELQHPFPVGDHTESHAWLVRLSGSGQTREIGEAAERIQDAGGEFPRLFRPPYGAFNATTLRVMRHLHMLLVLWSVDPGDWRRPGVGAIVSNVLRNARSGAIVIMHDGGGLRDQTVKALPAIIDGLRRRHFNLVTVPRLILDDPPPPHTKLPPFTGG